ncbi:hypothetical protein P7C70_g9442, partial [Phenoliferia sp. Uapishka_3]
MVGGLDGVARVGEVVQKIGSTELARMKEEDVRNAQNWIRALVAKCEERTSTIENETMQAMLNLTPETDEKPTSLPLSLSDPELFLGNCFHPSVFTPNLWSPSPSIGALSQTPPVDKPRSQVPSPIFKLSPQDLFDTAAKAANNNFSGNSRISPSSCNEMARSRAPSPTFKTFKPFEPAQGFISAPAVPSTSVFESQHSSDFNSPFSIDTPRSRAPSPTFKPSLEKFSPSFASGSTATLDQGEVLQANEDLLTFGNLTLGRSTPYIRPQSEPVASTSGSFDVEDETMLTRPCTVDLSVGSPVMARYERFGLWPSIASYPFPRKQTINSLTLIHIKPQILSPESKKEWWWSQIKGVREADSVLAKGLPGGCEWFVTSFSTP